MNAWDIYINGSREARMMHQLQHKNILSLVGLAFQPLRLILELAPLGDLKNSLKPFKQEKIKLNRRTLKQLIYQVIIERVEREREEIKRRMNGNVCLSCV